jgi:ferredoxin
MTFIEADTDICIGYGHCARVAAKYFDVREGVVEVRRFEVDAIDAQVLSEAVDHCPSGALRLNRRP